MRRIAALTSALVVLLTAGVFVAPAGATFPGQDGKLVFVKDGDLFLTDAEGQVRSRLTDAGLDGAPDFSPSGGRIVFERGPYKYLRSPPLYTIDADGTNVTRLAAGSDPSFFPGGRLIAFSRGGRIFVMRSDGSGARALTELADGWASEPSVSPDGRLIAFSRDNSPDFPWNPGDRSEIFVMDSDGSNERALTSAGHLEFDRGPDFSPDGERIVFSREPGCVECAAFVRVTNADDGSLTSGLASGYTPVFSPSGTRVAYRDSISKRHESDGLKVIDIDGSDEGILDPSGGSPDWGRKVPQPAASCTGARRRSSACGPRIGSAALRRVT